MAREALRAGGNRIRNCFPMPPLPHTETRDKIHSLARVLNEINQRNLEFSIAIIAGDQTITYVLSSAQFQYDKYKSEQ
jgi:hypothetical protein